MRKVTRGDSNFGLGIEKFERHGTVQKDPHTECAGYLVLGTLRVPILAMLGCEYLFLGLAHQLRRVATLSQRSNSLFSLHFIHVPQFKSL